MNRPSKISRRRFLKISAGAGLGLVVGVYLSGCQESDTATPEPTVVPTATPNPTAVPTAAPTATPNPEAIVEPDVLVRIDGTGTVTVIVSRVEMGQGVRTSFAMILAEELEADWAKIRVEQAPADQKYGRQTTGGSTSVAQTYGWLRQAGALAKGLLLAAAAQIWGVERESCYAEQGSIVHEPSGQRLSYGDLVETAATIEVSRSLREELKDPQEFQLIGRPMAQLDNAHFVDGSAVYGLDKRVPDMLYAVVARCPVFGGRVASFDPAPALQVEGVRQVVEIDRGVAVVAEHTWAALQGREALEVTWDEGEHAELSSAGVRQYLLDRAGPKEEQSDPNILEADYEIPFLSHVPMEPMNCLADVRADGCVVWAPTQDPADAKLRTLSLTHLHSDTIQVYIPLIGGGFGRRLQVDYVEEAVQVSQAAGAPVQVFWTREDDVRHDFYHPASLHRLSVDLQNPRLPRMRSWTYERIPTGPWRSATELAPAFARESFLDEMAAALGRDSYELRMELFTASNARAVLETVASEAGWGTPLPEGRARGMAYYATWGVTPTAHVVEVSVVGGMVRVHRVVCAIDCGIVINPDMVEAQMEGGILFGLTAALKGEITLENGRVQQGNFHDYPLWRIDEMPEVEVHIVDSEREPQGVGEMAVPPILPALLNAVYAATGKRIRHIPIRPEDLRDD